MLKLMRFALCAVALGAVAGSSASAATYSVTAISAGGGYACIDLACSAGAVLTLSPTPQGSLGVTLGATNTVSVVGTTITAIDAGLSGPLAFAPTGSIGSVILNPSLFPQQFMTSSNCVTVGPSAFCGATFRFDSTALGSGTNHIFLTVNLTAMVPEPTLTAFLAMAGLAFATRLRRTS